MIIPCFKCGQRVRVEVPSNFDVLKQSLKFGCPRCHTDCAVNFIHIAPQQSCRTVVKRGNMTIDASDYDA
jgi:Na+-translocating ferredoxin:NAD+ oxidoreductase RNF subunit RnfB